MKKFIIFDSIWTILLILFIIYFFCNYTKYYDVSDAKFDEIKNEINRTPYSKRFFPDIDTLENYDSIKYSYHKSERFFRDDLLRIAITIHLEYSHEKYEAEKKKIFDNTIFSGSSEYNPIKYSILNYELFYREYKIFFAPNMNLNKNNIIINSDKKIYNDEFYMNDESYMFVCFNDQKYKINYLCGYSKNEGPLLNSFMSLVELDHISHQTLEDNIIYFIDDFYWWD